MKYRNDLSFEYVNSLLEYDYKTGILYWKINRPNRQKGSIAGTKTKRGYINISINDTRYLAHRIIWLLITGEWPEKDVDHRDRNKSNNKKNNLRLASKNNNQHNRNSFSKSGYKGVYWEKSRKKWKVCIMVGGKSYWVGRFNVLEEAIVAYNVAAIKYHGKFAVLNEILENQTPIEPDFYSALYKNRREIYTDF